MVTPSDQKSFTSIRLQNFRSYEDYVVELSPGVNIIVGPNACGKTNLLESFMIASGFGSYRAPLQDLIQSNKEWFRVDAQLGQATRTVKVKLQNQKLEKSYDFDGKVKKRLNYDDIIPVVLFEPNHMQLLTGSPEIRRSFIDGILSKTDIEYAKQLQSLKRTLLQRNKLLKKYPQPTKDELFVWDVQLARHAGYIVSAREELILRLNEKLPAIYSEVAGETTELKISYISKFDSGLYESSLLKYLEQNLSIDIARGFTGAGPHRDDIEITIRNIRAEQTASRGETRTIVLALKLLEMSVIETSRGVKPLLLLDDVFSELDGSRRKSLTKYIGSHQTLITTTDADIVTKEFAQNSNLISLP